MTENQAPRQDAAETLANWDTASHREFYDYYAAQSADARTLERFTAIRDTLERVIGDAVGNGSMDVIDVGCGAGAQSSVWTEQGHRYLGVDINEPLVQLARKRAWEKNQSARFEVGTATSLPFADASFDVCVLPELLEHVADWRSCVDEAIRVLRPGGFLYVSTTNWLCPRQQEFNLPMYSWYPSAAKRYFERRAVSDWPAVANFAKYPAVNWFSFYELRRYLEPAGLVCLDRFDMMNVAEKGAAARAIVRGIRSVPLLRFLAHVATPYTVLIARKTNGSAQLVPGAVRA